MTFHDNPMVLEVDMFKQSHVIYNSERQDLDRTSLQIMKNKWIPTGFKQLIFEYSGRTMG